jgi:hypothetical protein
MRTDPSRNLAASVRQRLMNHARSHGEPFQTVLSYYAMERLLYRLSRSPEAERFVLKGALLFLLWSETLHRATRDIDLLGSGDPSAATHADVFRSLCDLPVPDDGIAFLKETVKSAANREDSIYSGIRVTLTGRLEQALIPVQVDIGFGDAVFPLPEVAQYPVILDFPVPLVRIYPRETVIAEKLHTLVLLDISNSRMKDFFDLYTLGMRFPFYGGRLAEAIRTTFERRATIIPSSTPIGLSAEFAGDDAKNVQWSAFLKRQPLAGGAPSLADAVRFIAGFLRPALDAAHEPRTFADYWQPGGPWTPAPEDTGSDRSAS